MEKDDQKHKAPGSNPLYDLIGFPFGGKYIGLSMMDLWVIWTLVKTKVLWAYIRKNGTNLSRYLSYIQIISAIPDDRGVGGMTISPDFQVVQRRCQNEKACKDLYHMSSPDPFCFSEICETLSSFFSLFAVDVEIYNDLSPNITFNLNLTLFLIKRNALFLCYLVIINYLINCSCD
ncbi:hypothetical protein H8356DRAFT_1326189 [Neocallimastix lanati (nom. inval.)]|nr:hypothetical protein H8356DRAFT_1326189 [Neocallimastix sp. JGI-2020a]